MPQRLNGLAAQRVSGSARVMAYFRGATGDNHFWPMLIRQTQMRSNVLELPPDTRLSPGSRWRRPHQ